MADLCNLEGVRIIFAEVLPLVKGEKAGVGRGSVVDLPGTSLGMKQCGITHPSPVTAIGHKMCRSTHMPCLYFGLVWLHACNTNV